MRIIDWNLEDELKKLPKLPNCTEQAYDSVRNAIGVGVTRRFQRYLNTLGGFLGIEFAHMPDKKKKCFPFVRTYGCVNFSGILNGASAEVHLDLYDKNESIFLLGVMFAGPYGNTPIMAKHISRTFSQIPYNELCIHTNKPQINDFHDAEKTGMNGFSMELHDNLALYIALSRLVETDRPFRVSEEFNRDFEMD